MAKQQELENKIAAERRLLAKQQYGLLAVKKFKPKTSMRLKHELQQRIKISNMTGSEKVKM